MNEKCAPCLYRLCRHEACKDPEAARDKVTDVAGTSSCGDCAGVLLEAVLHPPAPLVMTVPPMAIGGGGSGAAPDPRNPGGCGGAGRS